MSIVDEWQGSDTRALRMALNLNAKEFADALKIEERTVRRWEKPGSTVGIRRKNQRQLDAILLGAPAAVQRRFERLRRGTDSIELPASSIDADRLTIDAPGVDGPDQVQVLAHTADGKAVLVSLSRRALVAGLGLGAVAATIGTSPATSRALATTPADKDWVTHLRQLRLSLIDNDNLCGAGKILPLVEHNVDVIGTLRRTGAADAAQLQRLRVLYAECASWLHQDARNWDAATAWTDKANRWALTVKDPGCVAMVAIRRAHIACERGDGVEAIESAEAASAQAPHSSRVAAVAALFGGWGHALLRDAVASARAFDQARELAAAADDDSEWGMFLDGSYVDVHQATAAGLLGQHRTAINNFASAIATMRGGFTRDKAVYTARLALAHAQVGDCEAASALGVAAMNTGIATSSERVLAPIRQLHTMIDTSSTDPHIREFAAAAEVWLGHSA